MVNLCLSDAEMIQEVGVEAGTREVTINVSGYINRFRMYSKWSLKYVVWLKRNASHLLYLCHTQIVQLLGEYKTNSGGGIIMLTKTKLKANQLNQL